MSPQAPGTALSHVETAMGTVFSFRVLPGELTEPAVAAAVESACHLLHKADRTFSTWNPDSLVSRFRRNEIPEGELPAGVRAVIAQCRAARELSGGWFDPWAMPGGFDPTGLVKGWAIDQALAELRRAGACAAIVNGGGDVATFGAPAPGERWRVGIRHPWRADGLACVIETGAAVATSGCYERGLHLTDPHTGQPTARAASATVTGPRLALADALATALAVGGDPVLGAVAAVPGYAAYLIRPDGTETDAGGITFAA